MTICQVRRLLAPVGAGLGPEMDWHGGGVAAPEIDDIGDGIQRHGEIMQKNDILISFSIAKL